MLIIGDQQDDSAVKTYVGLFDNPIVAGNYAQKHFKGKKWFIDYILIIEG
jgi:hypothetical protein